LARVGHLNPVKKTACNPFLFIYLLFLYGSCTFGSALSQMALGGVGLLFILTVVPYSFAWSPSTDKSVHAMVARMNLSEKVAMMHGYGKNKTDGWVGTIHANKRLGIPPLYLGNGPQGFQFDGGTCWPSGLTVGATFDVKLAAAWGEAMGLEFFSKGDNVQVYSTSAHYPPCRL
jgi:hypothetical protein